jgi:periodic tryptophan protein 1
MGMESLIREAICSNSIQDTSTNPAVRRAFADRVAPAEGEIKERLVRVESDSSESEDEGIPEPEGNGGEGWESMDED